MYKIKQATKEGFILCREGGVADLSYPESKTRRGRVIEEGNISPTLTAQAMETYVMGYRIRKLTPRECWRLMSFSDEDFDKAKAVNSDSQLYKQAGNSICKELLKFVFLQMGIGEGNVQDE